jgi:predicted DNA-binding protein (MmcQ/YjbR family)
MHQTISQHALTLPGSFVTEQWGGMHVFKVGDPKTFKMFAILPQGEARVCVKTPSMDIAQMLIDAGVAEREVHLPRGGWVNLLTNQMDEDDVLERVEESYTLVKAGLPKRVRDQL